MRNRGFFEVSRATWNRHNVIIVYFFNPFFRRIIAVISIFFKDQKRLFDMILSYLYFFFFFFQEIFIYELIDDDELTHVYFPLNRLVSVQTQSPPPNNVNVKRTIDWNSLDSSGNPVAFRLRLEEYSLPCSYFHTGKVKGKFARLTVEITWTS